MLEGGFRRRRTSASKACLPSLTLGGLLVARPASHLFATSFGALIMVYYIGSAFRPLPQKPAVDRLRLGGEFY